jgi:hypothetical protein
MVSGPAGATPAARLLRKPVPQAQSRKRKGPHRVVPDLKAPYVTTSPV